MRGLLRSLAAGGRAVLVSSHLMSELQDTADHLVVIGRGKVIADASVTDLIAAASALAGRLILPGHGLHPRPRLPAAVPGRRAGTERSARLPS
jgi:ABC-2 type transport system ATP-binding protein